jgi:hypothetical protein
MSPMVGPGTRDKSLPFLNGISAFSVDEDSPRRRSAVKPQAKGGISRAKAAKEKNDSELGVLGVPSIELRACLM